MLAEHIAIQSEGKGQWRHQPKDPDTRSNQARMIGFTEALATNKARNQAIWMKNPRQEYIASYIPPRGRNLLPTIKWQFKCVVCKDNVIAYTGIDKQGMFRTCKAHRGMAPRKPRSFKPVQSIGKTERVVRNQATALLFEMHTDRFIALCIEHLSRPKGQRDTRRQVIQRAIKSLCRKGLFPAAVKYGKIRPV